MIERNKRVARLLAGMACGLSMAGAAWSIEPEPGMWNIDGELNGKPGRGIQIDTQRGKSIIVTYFGYHADGTSAFLQASGERTDTSFEGDLVEFKNGTVLGQARKDGETAATAGRVRITFTSATQGKITLPGETEKSFSRFQFEDISKKLYRPFVGVMSLDTKMNLTQQNFEFEVHNGVFVLYRNTASPEGSCKFFGSYAPAGTGIVSTGGYSCVDGTSGSYRTDVLRVAPGGFYNGTFYKTPSTGSAPPQVEYHYGLCSTGFADTPRCTID